MPNSSQYFYAIQDYDQAIVELDLTDSRHLQQSRQRPQQRNHMMTSRLKDFDQALEARALTSPTPSTIAASSTTIWAKTSRAVEDYDRAIVLDPNFGRTPSTIAASPTSISAGPSAALADFNNALRIDPKKALVAVRARRRPAPAG